jgi:hypothetical protein
MAATVSVNGQLSGERDAVITIGDGGPGLQRAHYVLGAIAVVLFAWLTQRHVGQSYFLADQVDQLQKFEALLRLQPEGLLGPGMSGTQARALGPFGAAVFGLPISLGLGINAIHACTSVLLALATAVAFFAVLPIGPAFAWTWLLLFTAMRITWWNAGMFWVNTLLLPLGLLMLALSARSLRRPSRGALVALVLLLLLALQVHLAALVAIPVIAVVAMATWRRTIAGRGSLPVLIAVGALALVAMLPYAIAEAKTRGQNTRAIFAHVDDAVHAENGAGRAAAIETLVDALDPAEWLSGSGPVFPIAAGLAVLAIALACGRGRNGLVIATAVGIGGQALFFLLMARPLNGLHYVSLLAPLYPVPLAAIVERVIRLGNRSMTTRAPLALAAATLAFLILRGPVLADRYAEPTTWTYSRIVAALNQLCGGEAAQTIEGPGLADGMNPQFDGVLGYLIKRGLTRCRYDATADVLIVGNRSGSGFADWRDVAGNRFRREAIAEPGLARYRRAP